MTTAMMISELLEFHDDALIADIDRAFIEIDRTVKPTPPGAPDLLQLIVDELVEEMLAPDTKAELTISLELEIGEHEDREPNGDIAEVA